MSGGTLELGAWVQLTEANSETGDLSDVNGPAGWSAAFSESGGVITATATNNNTGFYRGVLDGRWVAWTLTDIINASLSASSAAALLGNEDLLRMYKLELQYYQITALGIEFTDHLCGWALTDGTLAYGIATANIDFTPGDRDYGLHDAGDLVEFGNLDTWDMFATQWVFSSGSPFDPGANYGSGYISTEAIRPDGSLGDFIDPFSDTEPWISLSDMKVINWQGWDFDGNLSDTQSYKCRVRLVQIRAEADFPIPFTDPPPGA